jgi:hypothetical protein
MSSDVMPANQQSWTETPPRNPPLRHAIAQVVERQTWLDKLAAPLQSWLLKLYGQPGQPNRKIKDMLNVPGWDTHYTLFSPMYRWARGAARWR